MKASPRQQSLLLELQNIDTELLRLNRRLLQLPEKQELQELLTERNQAKPDLLAKQRAYEELQTNISRLESDVALVTQRKERTEAKLQVSAQAKEAQALQEELDALNARQNLLEERELEIMQQAEDAKAELDAALAAFTAFDVAESELNQKISTVSVEITTAKAVLEHERQGLAAEIQGDLREFYEKIRDRYGIGAAKLMGRVSGGSNMELDQADYMRVMQTAPDEIFICPVSGVILVRETTAAE